MTLSTYILGFALGQLLYGPMADSLGRKPVILGGTLVFAAAAVACAPVANRRYADCHAFLPRSGSRGGQRGD